ncbi:CopG family antitoxin [Aurantimonas sp. VKM B-3413]|uniref:CopG family antitoxin n=1 Tax=Aurantimonas sp. VKM B-3413 TaxID=2779401 RepID=UPI001E2D977B|nr:CopG family antitoxin [Aurantimonas sp. VKM B-3413]MCB8837296.1 BrnA antitoxin family protein [Aurantimonas sp. VKM B-3413]
MSRTTLKPMPQFATDEEAERFVDEADLSEYDLSGFKPVKMSRRSDNSTYSISMPSELLYRIDDRARSRNISIDEYILDLIRKDLGDA